MSKQNIYKFPVTDQDVLEKLNVGVDEKYILVLGTSHSAGSCVKRDMIKLPKSGTYAGMIEEETGIKTINLSVPGCDNHLIQQIALDAFSILDPKNCAFVVIESRSNEKSKEVFFDQIYPHIDVVKDIVYNLEIVSGESISDNISKTTWKCLAIKVSPNKLVGHLTHKKEVNESAYIASSAYTQVTGIKEQPKAEVKIATDILQAIKDDTDNVVTSIRNTYHNVVNLRNTIEYIRALNVPVCYFFWDAVSIAEHQQFQFEYLKEKNLEQYTVSGITESVKKQYVLEHGVEPWDAAECECGHHDSVVHAWVANKVLEDMEKYVR